MYFCSTRDSRPLTSNVYKQGNFILRPSFRLKVSKKLVGIVEMGIYNNIHHDCSVAVLLALYLLRDSPLLLWRNIGGIPRESATYVGEILLGSY